MSKNKDDNNFLVYMYMREDGTPYYVGKGRPERPYHKAGKPCAKPPRDRIVIYRNNLDEKTAFKLEKELIARYGRKDIGTGILHNRSDGGEGPSGRIMSEEVKSKWRRDWFHPVHGEALNLTSSELADMFPDMSLDRSSLCKVARECILHYKKWCLLVNKEILLKSEEENLKNWYHPKYGVVYKKSHKDLVKMFPDQKLKLNLVRRVFLGERYSHKGWILLENKDIQRRHPSCIPRDWYHPEYGEQMGVSSSELKRMFPNCELTTSGLCLLANKEIFKYKDWVILENKGMDKKYEGKLFDWFHESHGPVLQKSVSQLIKMFPEESLTDSGLHCVSKGKYLHHKGWKLLANRDVYPKSRYRGEPKNWFHETYGEVLGKSVSELAEMFPEQKLSVRNLRLVLDGKRSHHKGWNPLKAKEKKDL